MDFKKFKMKCPDCKGSGKVMFLKYDASVGHGMPLYKKCEFRLRGAQSKTGFHQAAFECNGKGYFEIELAADFI